MLLALTVLEIVAPVFMLGLAGWTWVKRGAEFRVDRIGQAAPADLVDPVSELRSAVGEIDGASDVRSAVNDARKTLRSDDPDEDLARAAMDEAIAELDAELAWRSRAEQELAPGLQAYIDGIGSSIGVRALDRMPNDVALAVAACEASHRNLSLNF